MISWRWSWSWLWFWWRFCDQTMSTCVATLSNGFGRGMEGHLNLQTRSGQSFTRLLCVTFLHDTWRSYLRNCIVLYRVFPRMVISFPTNIIRAERSSLQCTECEASLVTLNHSHYIPIANSSGLQPNWIPIACNKSQIHCKFKLTLITRVRFWMHALVIILVLVLQQEVRWEVCVCVYVMFIFVCICVPVFLLGKCGVCLCLYVFWVKCILSGVCLE